MTKVKDSAGSTKGQNSCTNKGIEKVVLFKTLNTDIDYINKFLSNWEKLIAYNCIITVCAGLRKEVYKSNTYHVSPLVLYTYTEEEIDSITSKLNTIFPSTENQKFDKFTNDTQFNGKPQNYNGKPNVFNICDYAICQLNDDVIVFHLDIYNGYGVTINNIFKSEELTQQFDYSITVPYLDTDCEENEEALLEEYFNSEEYEIDLFKDYEIKEDTYASDPDY